MTLEELRRTIESLDAYEAVASLGDKFVSSTLTDVGAFWAGDDTRRELYSVLALLHHAGANGLQAIIDYNESLWVPVLAYASKMIETLDVPDLREGIARFEELIAVNLDPSYGTKLPRDVIRLKELQEAVADQGLEWMEKAEYDLAKAGDVFVGCAGGVLPQRIVAWMYANADKIAPLIEL